MSLSGIQHEPTSRPLVAISVSFERDNLLARGLGLDHLKELLVRLTRPLLRQGVSLAYGGHWDEREDNFTYELLRLVSAEQADETEHRMASAPPATIGNECLPERPSAGRLINHAAWPHYLKITPSIEAQWINCCRIVRVTPVMAGIEPGETVTADRLVVRPDDEDYPALALLHGARCLSTMRQLMMRGVSLPIADSEPPDAIQPISARIVLGGKLTGYQGFVPGIFEEALLSLESRSPIYLLGGFGGATEALAEALLAAPSAAKPDALREAWQRQNTPLLARLQDACASNPHPASVRKTSELLSALDAAISKAQGNLDKALNNGLSLTENETLLTTRDMREALGLVHKGLARFGLMKALQD